MNKLLILASAIILFSVSCKKDKDPEPSPTPQPNPSVSADTVAPVIVLSGDNPYELNLGGVFSEPGYIAIDSVDGDVTSNVIVDVSELNVNLVGSYQIHYNVSDQAGNTAEAHRTVNVSNGSAGTDTTAPLIVLLGDNPYELNLGDIYSEPGWVAVDSVDGNITSSVVMDVSDLNVNLVGSYEIHYNVSDQAGNAAEVHRTVNVSNSLLSSLWAGNYSVEITAIGQPNYTYNESLASSPTIYNGLECSKFGDYANATAKLNLIMDGNGNVTVPNQSFMCGMPVILHQFSGYGTAFGTGMPGSIISLTITETISGIPQLFTYNYTKQ